jgi:hypothetical protein
MSARSNLSRVHHPDLSAGRAHIRRRHALDDGTPVEVVENGPSLAGRLAWLGARLAIRPVVAIGVQLSFLPWPWGLVDRAARALPPIPGTVRTTVHLPNCDAQFVGAKDVLPADGTRRVASSSTSTAADS